MENKKSTEPSLAIPVNVGVRIFAPASVANMACGYDLLGFALEHPGDIITARFSDRPGLRITKISGENGKLPYELERNTAGFAALQLLRHLEEEKRGIDMEIIKKMPFGSGLGSSAASAAAAVMAINELLDRPLPKKALLPFAVLGEQVADGAYHADNVAPSLSGGIILIRDNQDLDVHSLPVPEGLYATVVYPRVKILTKDARSILSDTISLTQHIQQNGNLGGLIVGLYEADYELIRRSLQDVIIEPQRARLIPHFHQVKEVALQKGVLGCSISGAGPSVFALSSDKAIAEKAGKAMQSVFEEAGIKSEIFVSAINQRGAVSL